MALGQPGVSACVTDIGQVTGDHAAFGVGVKSRDIREGRLEPGGGFILVEDSAFADMPVGREQGSSGTPLLPLLYQHTQR